jgi:hypothetical protein
MNTGNMDIFNTQARHLNYIAEHGYRYTKCLPAAPSGLFKESMFHPWMKLKYTFILG